MSYDSIPLNILSIFSLISFFIFFIVLKFSQKIGKIFLLDEDFKKPQAFHSTGTLRCGGLAIMISFLIFNLLNLVFFKSIHYDFLALSSALFILGFLDDIKIKINPNIRLIIMFALLIFFVNIFSIYIEKTGLAFLNLWLENIFFKNLFILLCFLFIINGSNLVDGFNGLLAIHVIILNSILLFINSMTGQNDLIFNIISQNILIFIFFLFNFPNAKMFLGDSGSYLLGGLLGLNVVKTSNLNPEISPFFFAAILFYIFFEVFFSFFRKLVQKKSPLQPDQNHFHMLTFYLIKKSNYKNPNALNGFLINLFYVFLIIPLLVFIDNPLFCRYWFFALLIIYTLSYVKLYKSKKNNVIKND